MSSTGLYLSFCEFLKTFFLISSLSFSIFNCFLPYISCIPSMYLSIVLTSSSENLCCTSNTFSSYHQTTIFFRGLLTIRNPYSSRYADIVREGPGLIRRLRIHILSMTDETNLNCSVVRTSFFHICRFFNTCIVLSPAWCFLLSLL